MRLKHGGGVTFGDFEAEFLAFEEDDARSVAISYRRLMSLSNPVQL